MKRFFINEFEVDRLKVYENKVVVVYDDGEEQTRHLWSDRKFTIFIDSIPPFLFWATPEEPPPIKWGPGRLPKKKFNKKKKKSNHPKIEELNRRMKQTFLIFNVQEKYCILLHEDAIGEILFGKLPKKIPPEFIFSWLPAAWEQLVELSQPPRAIETLEEI